MENQSHQSLSTESKSEEFVNSSLMAEAVAIREAIFNATAKKYKSVSVMLDSLQTIQAINNDCAISKLHVIFEDIAKI